MRILRLFLVIAAVAAPLATAASAQESRGEFVHRMTAWMTIGSGAEANAAPMEGQAPAMLEGPPSWLYQDPYSAEDRYCENGDCGHCNGCCHRWDVFGSAEFLLWWAKGTNLPPLLTTAPATTTSPFPGQLDQSDTDVLFGNEIIGKNVQAGGRITLGIWLDQERNVALGGRYFGLGGDSTRFSASSADFTYLLRPFNSFNPPDNNTPSTTPISFPGIVEGMFSARGDNNNVFGVDAFTEVMLHRECNRRLDLVFGYQLFRADDSLQLDSLQILPNTATIEFSDTFIAHNEFHGGQLGFHGRLCRGVWSIDALGKVGIGNMHQRIQIAGQAVSTSPLGVETVFPQGFLALPSNIGTFERNRLACIPEFTLNLKYHISRNLNVHAGYNFLWVSNFVTSGDQIDLRLNLGQPNAGPNLPAFPFLEDDYWLQGVNFGMNWDF